MLILLNISQYYEFPGQQGNNQGGEFTGPSRDVYVLSQKDRTILKVAAEL